MKLHLCGYNILLTLLIYVILNITTLYFEDNITPIHFACNVSSYGTLKLLIEYGADINIKGNTFRVL